MSKRNENYFETPELLPVAPLSPQQAQQYGNHFITQAYYFGICGNNWTAFAQNEIDDGHLMGEQEYNDACQPLQSYK